MKKYYHKEMGKYVTIPGAILHTAKKKICGFKQMLTNIILAIFAVPGVILNAAKKMIRKYKLRLTIVAFVFIAASIAGSLVSTPASTPEKPEQFAVIEVRLQPGDTIWDLVLEYTPDYNANNMIIEAGRLNPDKNLSEVEAYEVISLYCQPELMPE